MNQKFIFELTPEQTQKLISLLEKADSKSNQTISNQSSSVELLRVPDLSKLTGWAPPTIYAMTCNPESGIPFIKKGKSIFFEKEKILVWLNDAK